MLTVEAREQEIHEGKFFAIISYVSFLCIITLILKKDNQFALWHAKQGLVLFVIEVVAFILSIIPLLGGLIANAGYTLFLLVSIWGIIQAAQGLTNPIPVVTEIAEKVIL
jgi:fumarate reductase subunit D